MRRLIAWLSNPTETHIAFDIVARGYEAITGQAHWDASARRFARWLPATPRPRVLDLGAGPANSSLALLAARPDARVVALDRAPAMVRLAREAASHRDGLAVVLGDAAALPFPAATFDLATGHSFLYLVPQQERVLAEARRVLRYGSYVAFLEPAAGRVTLGAWARLVRGGARFFISMVGWRLFSGLHGRWTEDSLRAALEAAGFSDVITESSFEGLGLLAAARRDARVLTYSGRSCNM